MAAPNFLESISPWGSRSTTPKLGPEKLPPEKISPGLSRTKGGDHRISSRHRVNPKEYPEDCAPLSTRWFYAVDVPKRKPPGIVQPREEPKDLGQPKKYAPFSASDSRALEAAFQKLAEEEERLGTRGERLDGTKESGASGCQANTSINDAKSEEKGGRVKVPVNEDYLFDVDIETRELAPAYWLGPIYDVRRASWFYQDGASSRPCDENLAQQLEEGYLKAKPWRYEPPPTPPTMRDTVMGKRPSSWKPGDPAKLGASSSKSQSPRGRSGERAGDKGSEGMLAPDSNAPPKFQLQTHRLFGTYMNSIVTYQDSTVAWLLTDDFLSRMSSSVYQRFAGGGHLGGIKVVRGFVEPGTSKEPRPDGAASSEHDDQDDRGRASEKLKRRSAPPSTSRDKISESEIPIKQEAESETQRSALERRMASMVGSPGVGDAAAQEEEARRREEKEIENDYRGAEGDEQGREIEHLVLVTHGIGQRLGLKLQSLNFIHDVNVLRKTLKKVYDGSPDLQLLNSEVEKLPKNCRIQVLPVVWRHLLDFPKQSFKDNKERDLSETDSFDETEYPKLSDITVEGVPAIRNLIEDLFLDILLYQSGYREHIAGIVQQESNRVFKLFCERNPQFNGKVSLIGHSLGSAIFFDLLCRQRDKVVKKHRNSRSHRSASYKQSEASEELALDFEVEDFYCLGSPIGLFQMLKGKNIAARRAGEKLPIEGQVSGTAYQESLRQAQTAAPATDFLEPGTASSPKCSQLYNIFHPTDPIAYRIEPLISPAMKDLKPQPLPYVKKGLFGSQVQGLTGIGTRVGQSVSDFWSNITTGVASSLLNRSLGLTNDPQQPTHRVHSLSVGASNPSGAGTISGPEALEEAKRKAANAGDGSEGNIEHPPTLIDNEIQTLYSGFQKYRKPPAQGEEGPELGERLEWEEAETKARRYRREEAKVRALNSNGRVDYSIQEGVFDISLIASIASHLSYWADEDINHFIISQLLARQRVVQR